MKCELIIDELGEEKVIIYARKKSDVTDRIAAFVEAQSVDLIGFSEREAVKLKASDIFCFTVDDGKVYALSTIGKWHVKQRLYLLESTFAEEFVKINQSCLVNLSKIKSFEVGFSGAMRVILENGYKDYVSRRQLKLVKTKVGLKK